MKRTIINVAVILFAAVAAFLVIGHFRQSGILGSWSAPLDASVQFSRDRCIYLSRIFGGDCSQYSGTTFDYRQL